MNTFEHPRRNDTRIPFVEYVSTPIGIMVLTHDGKRIYNAEFSDHEERRAEELAKHFPNASIKRATEHSVFAGALTRYFKGKLCAIDKLPVAKLGTEFQQRAWKALRRIPAGQTRSYGEQAVTLGHPNAARAIGRTNSLNPIAIIVPCHRLIATNGSLVHYGGGIERKRWLLEHEAKYAKRE
jgi:methylated-DNA-[protein]-cysteine S-methyltransferase